MGRIYHSMEEHVKEKHPECRCKMRMSGLCKVEMSGFMAGRGAHGNRAHSDEPTRTGPVASVAGGPAKAFDASRSGAAAEGNRPPRAAAADPHWGARRGRDRSPITRPAVESQTAGGLGAEDSGSRSPALCRLRADAGCRTFGQGWFASEPRNAAEMDDPAAALAPAPPTRKSRTPVAGTKSVFRRVSDAG